MLDFAALFAFCDLHASRVRGSIYERLLDVEIVGPGPRYYDRQGFPIPAILEEHVGGRGWVMPTLVWAERKSDAEYSRVAWDEFPDGSYLSTVWLGLDHGFGGRPLFFETMYFAAEVVTMTLPFTTHETNFHPTLAFPDPLGAQGETLEQCRYGSEEEALAMHREIARRLRKRWEV